MPPASKKAAVPPSGLPVPGGGQHGPLQVGGHGQAAAKVKEENVTEESRSKKRPPPSAPVLQPPAKSMKPGEPQKCEKCSRSFDNPKKFQQHMEEHEKDDDD